MKLYFRLLSRAITPVVLAAGCLNSAPAVAMHHKNDDQTAQRSRPSRSSSTLRSSRAPSAERHSSPRRAPSAAPEPASIARASTPKGAGGTTAAHDPTVAGQPLSKIFPTFNLTKFFSEIEDLGHSNAYDAIERRVNSEVNSATAPLKAQRTRLQSQEADLSATIQDYMKGLTEKEVALTGLLDANDPRAEQAMKAYEMGIQEMEQLSALQAQNKAEIETLRAQESRLRRLGVQATTAISDELTRMRREAVPAALPVVAAPRATIEMQPRTATTPQTRRPEARPVVEARPSTSASTSATIRLPNDPAELETLIRAAENPLEKLESYQIALAQAELPQAHQRWLGRMDGMLDTLKLQLQREAEAQKAAAEAKILAEHRAREEVTVIRATEEQINILHTLGNELSSINNYALGRDPSARAEKQKRARAEVFSATAWKLRRLSTQEITAVFNGYFDAQIAREPVNSNYSKILSQQKTSWLQSVTNAQEKRRKDAKELFQQLTSTKKSALPDVLLEFAQNYPCLSMHGRTEDGTEAIMLEARPDVLGRLRLYRDYVKRTLDWLPPQNLERHQHIILITETLDQMIKEEKQNRRRQRTVPAPDPVEAYVVARNPARVGGGGGGGAHRQAPQPAAAPAAPAASGQRAAPRAPFDHITNSLS